MIGIVDYGAGNIRSVGRALSFLDVSFIVSNRKEELDKCDRLIFPGVGDASFAMRSLRQSGLDVFLCDWAKSGKRLLGICLGSQIIFELSEEGNIPCLGILKGTVRHFLSVYHDSGYKGRLKIPHMGWNDISCDNGGSKLLEGVSPRSDFYFVHSYIIQASDDSIVKAYTDYGVRVPAIVERGNVSAFQFHPEKSGAVGLRLLRNFAFAD